MANFFTDNDDLQFYLDKGIDWTELVRFVEDDFRAPEAPQNAAEAVQTYRDIMEMFGALVAEQVAPETANLDKEGNKLVDGEVVASKAADAIMDQFKELELYGLSIPRELGGMNCPLLLQFIVNEVLARADAGLMTHFGFHGTSAITLLAYSMTEGTTTFDRQTRRITSTRFEQEIREILRGEAWGAMDITEANAGSDMAALRTHAEQDDQGNWHLTGEKIFITSGHGKYHFVVARTEPNEGATAGLNGLSLFVVPTYETDAEGNKKWLASVDRIEEKIGHHSSATCTVIFDRTPGYLIGQRGEGFKQMLSLMNGARVAVGFEAIGVCEASYRLAKEYAAERKSMGRTIDKHEIIADYLDEMHTDLLGVRALAITCGYHEEMARRLENAARYQVEPGSIEAKQLERRAREHAAYSRRTTPLLKFLAAEKAVEMSRRSIQIHGGVGYTSEYGAEKLLRDALVLPIYEGTSQIQALMAMKDTLGAIIKEPQGFVRQMAQTRWRSVSPRDPLERRVARIESLALSMQQLLISKTAAAKLKALNGKPISEWPKTFLKNWDPKRDFAFAKLHAERLTRMLADVAICEALYDQAKKHPERREILQRYVERAEPRCKFLLDEATSTGSRLLGELAGLEEEDAAPADERRSA